MKTDILIVGGGLTAYAAAYEILQNSQLHITILTCGGGASPFIHGFCLPIGDGDSGELFLSDTLSSGYHQSSESLARALCFGTCDLAAYFSELGQEIDRDEGGTYRLLHSLGSSVPRIAGINNAMGPSMLSVLKSRLQKSDRFTLLNGFRAVELIRSGERVIGAKCYDDAGKNFQSIFAGTVILASGGFGRLFPESTNSADIGGDGCAMAYRAGAKLTDMEFIQFEPSAAVWPPQVAGKGIVTTMFYDGAVLRGVNGNRFMLEHSSAGECVAKDVLSKCIYHEIRKNGASIHGGVWFDATAVSEEKWQTSYKPYLNRYLACGIDLRKEPVEIAPAAHTTCGGILIDEKCRTGVPGLIACGEVTGGLHGANRLGGNAGLETIVFGRIAGATAVSEWAEVTVSDHTEEHGCVESVNQNDLLVMRKQMQSIVRTCLNVIRCGKDMQNGLHQVEDMICLLDDHHNDFQAYRLYNDLQTVRLALLSAISRLGSVGCHCREDSVEEKEKYRVVIFKSGAKESIAHLDV